MHFFSILGIFDHMRSKWNISTLTDTFACAKSVTIHYKHDKWGGNVQIKHCLHYGH